MTSVAVSVPRVVLDTNVSLDLFLFHDANCAALLQALQGGLVQAVTRADCRDEWRRVLHYPQLPINDNNRTTVSVAFDVLVHCLPQAQLTGTVADALPRCRDADDQKFLELAVAAGADWLLSKDHALLQLDRRMRALAGFSILTPQAWVLSPQ